MLYCLATRISILLVFTAIIAVLFVIAPGCVSQRSMQSSLPQVERLKTRVDFLYRAQRAKNAKQFYSLTSPEFQRWCNYEDFVADFTNNRSEEVVSYKIRTICPDTDNEMNVKAGTQAARVEMDVLIRWPDGQLKPTKDQTDYWVYTGDDWYWSWRGWYKGPATFGDGKQGGNRGEKRAEPGIDQGDERRDEEKISERESRSEE